MKRLRLLIKGAAIICGGGWLVFAAPPHAESIAVLAKNEIVVVGAQASGAMPADPACAAFLEAFRSDSRNEAPLPVTLPLVSPPEWGKTISAKTRGRLSHRPTFENGFVGQLRLEHLEPNHRYILTLNGRPDLPGNEALPTPVPGLEAERYYDFLFIETDADGTYEARLGVFLPPALYQVRLYVKDAVDFRIVLYHDYFPFTVEPGAGPASVPTTTSDNLALVRSYWEDVWSRGELTAVADFYAPDCKQGPTSRSKVSRGT